MVVTHLPLRRSVPVGIVAYALGFLLTVGATVGRVDEVTATEVGATVEHVDPASLGQIFGGTPPSWVVGGWLFYNAHFVPTSLPTADAMNGMSMLTNRNLLTTVGGPAIALYLVVPALLLAAGYVVARTAKTYGANGRRNAGASIAVGYFPMFLLGAFGLTASPANAGTVASPAGLPAVFLGLAYPVVFGAIGGKLAEWHAEPESASPDRDVQGRW
jgi:hypothetical protein